MFFTDIVRLTAEISEVYTVGVVEIDRLFCLGGRDGILPERSIHRFVLSKDGVLLVGDAAGWGQAKGAGNMIDIFEALGWLNGMDSRSYLNDEAFRLITEARRFSLSDRQVRQILRSLRIIGQSSTDPLQRGETLLHCSAIEYSRNWFPEGARDATRAIHCYQDDPYRHAVALWILGAAQWEMCQNHAGYENWDMARRIFQQQLVFFQYSPLKTDQHKSRIRRMEVLLAMRPEEIMTWLNHFEDSSLQLLTQPIVRRVREKIRKQECPNIYVLMQDLQDANQSSRNAYERAEIYLEFGLAIYQLGNLYSAIDLLRKAGERFYPGIGTYHKEVVARCMLGAVEWMNEPPPHNQAIADWTVSIEDFEKLRTLANRNNDFTKRDWYTDHRRILCATLDERLPRT